MSNDLNDLPVQQLHDVAWDKITEEQAQGFGLSLSLFNDSAEAHARVRAVFMARCSALIVATVTGITLLTWAAPAAAVAGMIGALSLGAGLAAWQLRKASKALQQATESLKADVGQLPQE